MATQYSRGGSTRIRSSKSPSATEQVQDQPDYMRSFLTNNSNKRIMGLTRWLSSWEPLLPLKMARALFPASTTIWNSRLFWPPQAPGAHMAHKHAYTQSNTHTDTIKIIKSKKQNKRQKRKEKKRKEQLRWTPSGYQYFRAQWKIWNDEEPWEKSIDAYL